MAIAASATALAQGDPPKAPPAAATTASSEVAERPTPVAPPLRKGPTPLVPPLQRGDKGGLNPRLELYIPSARMLLSETQRSHAGMFVTYFGHYLRELAGASAEGVDAEEATAILDAIGRWPDTSISAVMFAPDTEGRLRWSIRLDSSVEELHDRVRTLLSSDAAREAFTGISMEPEAQGGFVVALPESTIAYLLPAGSSRSYLASHQGLEHPDALSLSPGEGETAGPSLVSCRLNFADTEQDSGKTFLSSFSVVTAIDYAGRVDSGGQWVERLAVRWPALSGIAIKTFFGRVKNSFFVPDAAFGSVVFSAMAVPVLLENLAGLGQQVVMEEGGEMSLLGEPMVGPIAGRVKSQVCVTVLPGTGFLPMPDIVIQSRLRRAKRFESDVRASIEKINAIYRDRDEREPWHEATVQGRTVFWSDGARTLPGAIMPLTMRPVVFATKETDAKEKERDFFVLAWTSTSPQRMVRRWLDLPRTRDRHTLPTVHKANGQVWINWDRLYRRLHPYFDIGLSIVSTDALFPSADQAESSLTDAFLTVKTKYTGMTLNHQGPIPLGAVALPLMAGASAALDASGGSDLARERLASQRLKVLYHHCKLFHKDLGRWPAEVAELDGYVDFAGNPQLLELRLSSRKQWGDWFEGILDSDADAEEADEVEDDEADNEIDDDLFVIHWGRDRWTLGIAPGSLEHLDQLYIDERGDLHRVARRPNDADKEDGVPHGVDERTSEPELQDTATP